MAAWIGGAAIGVANGAVREAVYAKRVGDLAAHQLSSASAIGLFGLWFWLLERRWPIPSSRSALRIGGTWICLTVAFEVGLGRLGRRSASEMLRDYDLRSGHVWPLVLLWLGIGPAVVGPATRRRHGRRRVA